MANITLDVSVSPLTVNIHAPDDIKYTEIKAVCKQLLPAWSTCTDDAQIQIDCISGGISNALYKVTPPPTASLNLSPVVFRIYGDGTERFVNRNHELTIMKGLHANNFGPDVLAAYTNGRIETFLSLRCMTPDEMSQPFYVEQIAAKLAQFHAVPMPGKPSSQNSLEGNQQQQQANGISTEKMASTPFGRIREWLSIARTLDFSDTPDKEKIFKTFDFNALVQEVDRVEQAANTYNAPTVFAHCDLLSGNIMISEDNTPASNDNGSTINTASNTEMTFIDFEYADWAPRGFDLGNHFCEYAGFDCDYTKYPDADTAARFIKAYLLESQRIVGNQGGEQTQQQLVVEKVVAEANVYALAAHMYWGAWAFMQAKWSVIDFDYMGYAALRWGEYFKRREEFLKNA